MLPLRSSLCLAARKRSQCRGAACFEFAVCLPVLALLVFGCFEATSFIFLKQSLNIAAREGAREAIRPTATSMEAQVAARAILESRGVRGATIRFPRGDVATVPRGETVLIEVGTTSRANSPLAGHFLPNRPLVARTVMVKE